MIDEAGAEGTAAWTVLVYLAGDNNLTEEMAWGLQELKKTAAQLEARPHLAEGDRINVVAHFDPRGSRSRRYDFAPRGSASGSPRPAEQDGDLHRYEAVIYTRRATEATKTEARAGVNGNGLSNPLAAFVREQVERLPRAKRYLLVLSGHGSGASGDFLIDSDPKTSLSIPELARILDAARDAYARSSKGQAPRIDILGMDSCLMSNAEVCFEVREHADYLVASEGWVANAGWPYHRVLGACLTPGSPRPDLDPASVAQRIAARYSEFYEDYEITGISTDVAACRLEAFRSHGDASLLGHLQALSRACIGSFDAVFVQEVLRRTPIGRRREAGQALVRSLGEQVARLLCDRESERKSLADRLANGSALATGVLEKALEPETTLSASQRKARAELKASVGEAHGLSEPELVTQVFERSSICSEEVTRPRSATVALSVVNLLRELDPGIRQALEIIEELQRKGRPEATRARVILQKLHQVQWVLDLHEAAKDLAVHASDVHLLNAVVASRWRAQSFKSGVYVDLFDFCKCLEERLIEHEVQPLCAGIRKLVSGAVLTSLHTGAATQHARGLSVYFPCQAADYAPEYDNLEFAKKARWGRLVRSYLRATRRERREESERWARAEDHVVRFGRSEVDPLEPDGIEARIVGVIAPAPPVGRPGMAGVKSGTETRIRSGTETKIRSGTEAKIRGEGVLFEWGNPPDGFFRPAENGKWDVRSVGS